MKVMLTISLLHSTLNISQTVRVEALFQMTTNRKWHMGYQMVSWPMTSRDPSLASCRLVVLLSRVRDIISGSDVE